MVTENRRCKEEKRSNGLSKTDSPFAPKVLVKYTHQLFQTDLLTKSGQYAKLKNAFVFENVLGEIFAEERRRKKPTCRDCTDLSEEAKPSSDVLKSSRTVLPESSRQTAKYRPHSDGAALRGGAGGAV